MNIASFIISLVALMVSFLAIYIEFFRKVSSISMRLVNLGHGRSEIGIIDFSFCFGNSGNVQYLVNEVKLVSLIDGEGELVHTTEVSGIPVILESNKVNSVIVSCNAIDFVKGGQLYIKVSIVSPDGKIIEYMHEVAIDKALPSMWKVVNLNNKKTTVYTR